LLEITLLCSFVVASWEYPFGDDTCVWTIGHASAARLWRCQSRRRYRAGPSRDALICHKSPQGY